MARIHEEVVIIKLSKLVKDEADVGIITDAATIAALEQVTQELIGEGIIVEIERA